MFSFRKIVNVLVLVAYVKMTLVSSFAVDVGSLPPGKVQYKLKVDRQLNEAGALEYIQLSLQHKDLQTGEKKTLRCDRIDDPETVPAEDIDWTTENKRETGYKWRYIKKFGQVRVGLDGQIFLQNINQLDTNVIFKVKGPHLITLRNCQISHLHTQALSTIFIGATNIDTLHAKATQEQGGVYLYAHKSTPSAQVQIKNMHLKGDNFVNHSHLIATGKGTWDLGGGDFINSGTLTSQGAPQTITSVRLFDNVGQIGGESISLQTQKHVNESQGEINLNKYAVTAQELFINDGKIHTLQQGLYKWKGEAINGGQIISDNSYAFSSLEEASSPILINNGVMRAQQGEFRYIKLANYGEMDQQKSVLTRIALVNSGQCKLGWMDQKSDCRITELVNRGQMSGTGFLSIDKGQNYGELNLSGLRLTLGAGGELINTAQVWLSTLLGEGKFINRGTFHTAQTKGITALYIHSFDNRGGKIVGKQLQLKETLEAFICDADSSLDLASLIIYSAASPQTSLLHLAGTIQCSQGLKIYERKVSVDGSIITPHFWSEGGEISFTANGRLQTPATKLINSKLLNQGTVDLGKVSFTNAQLVNSNALTFESNIESPDGWGNTLINSGTVTITTIFTQAVELVNLTKLFYSHSADNSGKVIFKGDYAFYSFEEDGRKLFYPLQPGKGSIDITGRLSIDSCNLVATYPFIKDRVTAAEIVIDGQGQDVTFNGEQDWSFGRIFSIRNAKSLTFEDTIKVNSARFENVGHLWIKKLLEVKEGDLNAANLGQFTVGVDNQNLGQVNADNGAVNIEAEGTVDLRYGSVQSTKQTLLKSLTKDVMLGARLGVMTEQSYKPTGKRLNNPFYEKSHLNGTCVSAADHLRIEAPLGNILLEYGQLQAGRGLMLIARDRIYNLSGALSVIGDLVLQAKTYHQTRIDLRAFQGTSSNPNYQHLCYYLEQADPSTINVIGNLYSETETFTNEYGSVLISQNFYHHNALQDVENLPQSIKNISRATLYDVKEVGTGRWYTEKGATPPSIAKLKVGEKIHIKIGSAEMSGSMSAPIINLYAQAAAFSNPVASRSPSQTTERVTVNLNEFIEDIRQDPSHHLLRIGASGAPSLDSTLVQGEKPEGTIINPLTDVNVEFYLYQLFSEITGRAYLKQGNTITSGFALVEQLKKNSRHLKGNGKGKEKAEDEDDFEDEEQTESIINLLDLAHIFYSFKEIKDAHEQQLWLSINAKHTNTHQGCGDVDGENVHIHTTESQSHQGNAVHAEQKLALTSEHHLAARSASLTGDESCELQAETAAISRQVHRQNDPHGYTEILGAEAEIGSARGTLKIATLGDLAIAGVHGFGLKGIALNVGGNYIADTVTTETTHTYSSKKCTTYEYDLVNYGNRFSTGKHVNSVWAAKLPSEQQGQNHMITKVGGHTFIRGGTQLIDGESPRETAGSTLIVPAIDIHQRIEQKSKKRKFLGRLVPFREGRKKKTVRNESGYTQLQRHRQDARGLIREKAKADVSLHAVDYTAGANIEVESETGQIKVPAVISESWNQTQKRSKDDHWQSRSSTWEHDQEANVSRFSPGTGSKVILKAPKGIVAPRVQEEHKHVKGENERTEVYSKKFTGPGYEWLEELKLRDDVIWEDVIEKHHSGRVAAQGMTTAAKIAAVIVITILTWGTGTPAVTGAGTASGAAAGGAAAGAAAGGAAAGASAGAATVGAASVTATTAGAAAGAGAAASSFTVAANAAMSAAFEAIKTATIQHFAIGAVGQRGRMDRVIESYATPQNFRSMAVDAISAGLTQGMSQYFKIETTQMNGFMEQVKGNGLKFAANFAAQTAVHGKADEALKNAAISFGVDTVFGSMTNDTGERRSGQIGVNDTFMQKVLHKVEHFLIGGLREGTSAALHGKKGHELSEAALGGAIGAATAEILAESLLPAASRRIASQLEAEGLTPDSQAYKERYSILKDQQMEKIKAYGQLAAVGAANTLGLNVEAAQSAALKAMENNTGRVFGAFSIISDTAIDDFSQQEDQAKAADETCVRSEAELEAILDQWDDLREENQLLQKGQYRPGTGDTASTAEDVSGLFFDAATRDQRIANIKARNVMSDKTRQLLVEHYTAHTTFQQLAQQPYLMVKPTERRFDIIERAKQALASHTAPDLAQVSGYAASSSSSTGPSVMMASLAATATTAGHIMQGPMPRFAAATAGGAPAMFELAAAGFGKVPLNPSTALRVAVALGLTYGAYKGYEWYQDREQARESQAAAEREDFKQAYESSRSQQGQAWLQRHTYNLAAADTAIPGVYNPSTDKGKERVSGSSTSHCETTDPVQGWVDAGFTTEPAKVQILSTPMPEPARPDIEGFDPASLGIDTTLPGFEIYDGPQIQILTRDQKHSIKSRLKEAQLPTQGKIRFIPPKEYNPSTTLKRGNNYGYLDRFGNEWTKGPSRTQGQEFEWDVQLSRQGKNKIGWASRDGSHVNVSLDGEITHK